MRALAEALAAVFGGLAAVHVYWAFGGRRGHDGAIPVVEGKPLFRPGRGATLVVAALLAIAGGLILARAGVVGSCAPTFVTRWGTWGVAAVLTLRAVGDFKYVGFFKRRVDTRFARLDARYYSPLALALGVGGGIIAWVG
jgi:Protein of unknown function (DUF3995)